VRVLLLALDEEELLELLLLELLLLELALMAVGRGAWVVSNPSWVGRSAGAVRGILYNKTNHGQIGHTVRQGGACSDKLSTYGNF